MTIINLIKKLFKIDIIKNSSNYFLGDLISKAIAFITIPIFTRLLIPSDYGQINIYTSLVNVNTIIFSLGFTGAISNKYLKEKSEFKQFLGTNLTFLFIVQIFILIILFFLNDYLSQLFNINKKILILANISGVLMVSYQIYQHYLKATLQSRNYVILSIAYSVTSTIISIILIWILKDDKYLGRIFGFITAIILVSSISLFHLFHLAEFKFEKKHLYYALSFGIPFIPHLLSQFILSMFDRIIINQLTGSVNTGLYSLAYNVGNIINALSSAIIAAFIPEFYRFLNNADYEKINLRVKEMTNIILIGALFMIFFAKEIIAIMAAEEFHSSLSIIPWIIVGNVFFYFYMIYSVYATYDKKTGIFSLITLIAGAINILLNYLFIPVCGYKVAAVTTMISYFLLFLFHFINAKFFLKKIVIPIKTYLLNFIFFIIFILSGLGVSNNVSSPLYSFLIRFILFIVAFLWLFKDMLKKIRNIYLKK